MTFEYRKKSILWKSALLFIVVLAVNIFIFYAHGNPQQSDQDDNYKNDLMKASVLLQRNKEMTITGYEQNEMLQILDKVMQDEKAAEKISVKDFYKRTLKIMNQSIMDTDIYEGAIIWKLYNHGILVRTPEATIAIDLDRGFDDSIWSDEFYDKIVDGSDILLVTNKNTVDTSIYDKFIKANKSIMAPGQLSVGKYALVPKGSDKKEININGVKIDAYSLESGTQACNVYHIYTADKLSILITSSDKCLSENQIINNKKTDEPLKVDVLIADSAVNDMLSFLKHVTARRILTTGENNLIKPASARMSYMKAHESFKDYGISLFVPVMGQSLYLEPTSPASNALGFRLMPVPNHIPFNIGKEKLYVKFLMNDDADIIINLYSVPDGKLIFTITSSEQDPERVDNVCNWKKGFSWDGTGYGYGSEIVIVNISASGNRDSKYFKNKGFDTTSGIKIQH